MSGSGELPSLTMIEEQPVRGVLCGSSAGKLEGRGGWDSVGVEWG